MLNFRIKAFLIAPSMDKLTPGRKLILDLLAKSVAKIQAAEAENEMKVEDVKVDGRKGKMKREFIGSDTKSSSLTQSSAAISFRSRSNSSVWMDGIGDILFHSYLQ